MFDFLGFQKINVEINGYKICDVEIGNGLIPLAYAKNTSKNRSLKAIPTLFDIPNPPLMITPLPRKSVYKNLNNSIASSNAKLVNSVSNQIPTIERVQNVDDTPTILENKIKA